MTWFSLPITRTDPRPAFVDAASAANWLTRQPQANAPAMQAELVRQLQQLNGFAMPARERFKTLEVLRKTAAAIDAECQRRYEGRPLPLAAGEQALLDASRQLWRACAIGYLHCLRACLDDDPGLTGEGARAAHRVLASLRMEQASDYAGGAHPDDELWRILHAVLASAEQLGVARTPVSDRLLGETAESTVVGQYAMLLLLHLARPFELSRGQLAAATRWFARWREQADVLDAPDDPRPGHCAPLDLAQAAPLHALPGAAGLPRWLALSGVLRKMRKRLEALALGESPETLKLGSGLTSEACSALLRTLGDNLRHPPPPLPDTATVAAAPETWVVCGLESIYRQIGGDPLLLADQPERQTHWQAREQIAVFGHVVRTDEGDSARPEAWRTTAQDRGSLRLCRLPGQGEARLPARALTAVRPAGAGAYTLAAVQSLCAGPDGALHATLRLLPGAPRALPAEVRERPSGKTSRHPAFLLPAVAGVESPAAVLLPAGVPARAQSINLMQDGVPVRLEACLERGGDYERWLRKED